MAPREERHKVRDISVRLWRDGSGDPVMFLHGANGMPGWLPFFAKLAETREMLVPEHPGFGKSDNPPWIRNVGDVAMYYLDLLDGLGQPVHLIGHSLGGWIAAELAVRNCEHLISLTLIAPGGCRVKGVTCGDNFIWSPDEAARNLYFDQALAEQVIARVPTDEEADLMLTNRFMAAKLGWEPRWFNPSLERWLHRIKVPTLVVWGQEDRLLPAAYAEVWRREVKGVAVEIIPACGHIPQIEKMDVVAKQVLAFVGKVTS